jgi:glycosyltransferase involved in cell wall biosynthesis
MYINKNIPIVTVLIDTYNYEKYIGDSITSTLEQTFPTNDLEIVVIDDGSNDNTSHIVKKFGHRVKYYDKNNGGQASALNLGFEKAKGQYIVLLDADDYMHPTRVEKIVSEFENYNEVGMVLNRRKIISDNDDKYDNFSTFSNLKMNYNNLELISQAGYGTSRTSIRKRMFKDLFPIPETGLRIEADLYLNLAALWFTNISSLEDYLTIYRIHGNNLFSVTDVNRFPLQIDSMNSALHYIKKKAMQSSSYNQNLLTKLLRPYEIHLQNKKISYNSMLGKDCRLMLFSLEITRLKYYWKTYSSLYKIYKILTIPLTLIISSENYLKIKDKYNSKQIYKVRESVFPNKP